jgi:hypothetical protein
VLCISGLDAVDNQILAALALRCGRLRRLEAAGCSRVGGAGLVVLAGGCAQLGLVDVRACPRVGAASAAAFRRRIPLCELRVDDAEAAARAAEGGRNSADSIQGRGVA